MSAVGWPVLRRRQPELPGPAAGLGWPSAPAAEPADPELADPEPAGDEPAAAEPVDRESAGVQVMDPGVDASLPAAAVPGHGTDDVDAPVERLRAQLRAEQQPDGADPGPTAERPSGAGPSSLAPGAARPADGPPPPGVDEQPIGAQAAAAVQARDPASREPFPRPAQRRVITVANQKGGVGKTTSTVNLAVALAQHGARVLVVDLDPQGNCSTGLGVPHTAGTPNVYDVLVDDVPMAEVVQPADGVEQLWCVPATIDLAGAEIELVSMVARESRLKRAIETYCAGPGAELDYVLVDCPPSLGLLTVNAMVATSELLIPIQCEYYALEGLGQLLKNVDLVRGHLNPALHVSTILMTMYDARTRLADQVVDQVREHFGDTVLSTAIPRSVRVSEAPGYGQSVVTYDPGSRGALAYVQAARELAQRGAPVRAEAGPA